MNGLDIDFEQFKRMNSKDRDELIYKNLVHIRTNGKSSKLNTTLQYAWLFTLTIALGFKKYLGL